MSARVKMGCTRDDKEFLNSGNFATRERLSLELLPEHGRDGIPWGEKKTTLSYFARIS